eukprot:IDg16515t1
MARLAARASSRANSCAVVAASVYASIAFGRRKACRDAAKAGERQSVDSVASYANEHGVLYGRSAVAEWAVCEAEKANGSWNAPRKQYAFDGSANRNVWKSTIDERCLPGFDRGYNEPLS